MHKSNEVSTYTVANSLPVNDWFDRVEFARYTGIGYMSSKARLNLLSGFLIKRKVSRRCSWLMTLESKKLMLAVKKRKLGWNKKGAKQIERIATAEELAVINNRESAESILKLAGFI